MKTEVQVSSEGKVSIDLMIKNISKKTLYGVAPMFHFHHAMSPMPNIASLKPGESRLFTNKKHPRVLRSGRYPLVVMAKFNFSPEDGSHGMQTYMSSFDYRESIRSAIYARLESDSGSEGALLKIFLENKSDSFKNLRLMLLLPKGLRADTFGGEILGFTIRGRETKKIEIPVTRTGNIPGGRYIVYLMTEYGEMEKHYSDEFSGTILFESSWREISYKTHVWFIVSLSLVCSWLYFSRKRTLGLNLTSSVLM